MLVLSILILDKSCVDRMPCLEHVVPWEGLQQVVRPVLPLEKKEEERRKKKEIILLLLWEREE